MSKATSSAVRNFNLLPEDWRTMVVSGVREFRGTSIDPQSKERTRLVDIIVRDVETGVEIHKNYSLDRPSYLAQVIEAIAPGQSAALLDEIDWATDDTDALMGIEFEMKVYHEEFPVGSGTFQNKVGAARSIQQPENTDNESDESAF